MPEPVILHRCPHCERVFDSPSFCMEGRCETEPFPAVVPKQHPVAPKSIEKDDRG